MATTEQGTGLEPVSSTSINVSNAPSQTERQENKKTEVFLRGRYLLSAEEAAVIAEINLDEQKELYPVRWGGVDLPSKDATTHFCVVGATGSGKTTIIRLLMQSCLKLIGKEKKHKPTYEFFSREEMPSDDEIRDYENALAAYELDCKKKEAEFNNKINEIRNKNKEIELSNRDSSQRNVYLKPLLMVVLFAVGFFVCICGAVYAGLAIYSLFILDISSLIGYLILSPICFLILKAVYSGFKNMDNFNPGFIPLKEEPKFEIPPFDRQYPVKKEILDKREVVSEDDGHRALIYDAKGDMLSILASIDISADIFMLNPFDERSAAWDMAKDITSNANSQQLATILIPEDKNSSQPFFNSAARDLLTQVIIAFNKIKPGQWEFRDIVLTLRSPKDLKEILSKTEQGKSKLEIYAKEERTFSNILSEISTKMFQYEIVAAVWSKAKRKISLNEWVNSEQILVLGSSEEHRSVIEPINRVIFQRATELLLAQQSSMTRRTWFFLDEARNIGNIESLGRLMTMGRSKGGCVVLGFQDINGMYDAFGKEKAMEFIGQCANKAILRLDSAETAKWASELFGKYEFLEKELSTTSGEGDTTTITMTDGVTHTTGTSEGTNKSKTSSWGRSQSSNNAPGAVSTQVGTNRGGQITEGTQTTTNESTASQESVAKGLSKARNWSSTENEKRLEKDAILPAQFMNLPVTDLSRNGLHGYYSVPSIGAFKCTLSAKSLRAELIPEDSKTVNVIHRNASEQEIEPWTEQERKALGLDAREHKDQDAKQSEPQTLPKSKSRLSQLMDGWLPGTSDRSQEN